MNFAGLTLGELLLVKGSELNQNLWIQFILAKHGPPTL
jgi:hypothetical protein